MFPSLFASQLVGISVIPLLDLEADTGITVSDTDKVDVWGDQSGNGYNFTQTGTARPALATVGGYQCVQFDGVDDWMLGQNWAALDNLSSWTFFVVGLELGTGEIFNKIVDSGGQPGYSFGVASSYIFQDASNYRGGYWNLWNPPIIKSVGSSEVLNLSTVKLYSNSVLGDVDSAGSVSSYATAAPLNLGKLVSYGTTYYSTFELYAIRVYSPALSSVQRIAVEQELANRYGITL